MGADLDHMAEVVAVGFLHSKSLFHPSLSMLYVLEAIHCMQLTLKE